MKTTKLLPAALMSVVLSVSCMAFAQDEGNASHNATAAPHNQHVGKDGYHHGLWELLPESKVKLLHETMEKVHQQNQALHEQAHKLSDEKDAILKAPQFDQDAYLKKSAELDDVHMQMKKNMEKAFASVAAKFTPEERKVLAVLHHMMHHHHHEHGGQWHHHGDMQHHDGVTTQHDGGQAN